MCRLSASSMNSSAEAYRPASMSSWITTAMAEPSSLDLASLSNILLLEYVMGTSYRLCQHGIRKLNRLSRFKLLYEVPSQVLNPLAQSCDLFRSPPREPTPVRQKHHANCFSSANFNSRSLVATLPST